jgi:hypothetical protein
MYLVSSDYLNTSTSKNTPPPPPQSPNTGKAGKKHNSSKRLRSVKKIKKKKKNKYLSQREHDRRVAKRFAARRGRDYDKWFKVRGKLHEEDIERKNQIKTVADFLKQVLPASPSSDTQTEHGPPVKPEPSLPTRAIPTKRRSLSYETTTPTPSTSSDVVYETSTPQPLSIKRDVDDDDDDDYVSTDDQQIEPDVLDYGAMTVGALASPYVSPYLYESKKRCLDTEYGIRRDADGLMIGDSRVGVDSDGNIQIKNVEFPATKGLWELLTRKRVDNKSITRDDLKQYKTIFKRSNAHLEGYNPEANIRTSKGLKYWEVISRLFPGTTTTRQSGAEAALRREWITY